jgi:hypothetical protein
VLCLVGTSLFFAGTGRNISLAAQNAQSNATGSSSNSHMWMLLSTSDPDTWVGQRVQVTTGRHSGQQGTVISSGNGWVQIETAVGEVAKRAYELQIVPQFRAGNSSSGGAAGGDEDVAGGGAVYDAGDGGRGSKRSRTSSKHGSASASASSSGYYDGTNSSSGGGGGGGRSRGGGGYLPTLDTLSNTLSSDDTTLLMNLSSSSSNNGGSGFSFAGRKRPRAYSDSLMTLSPSLLGNGSCGGMFPFRTHFSPNVLGAGTISATTAAVSGLLASLPTDDGKLAHMVWS